MEADPCWHQEVAIPCPDPACDGMLLQSIYHHAHKCSKCGRFWMNINNFVEVELS